MHLFLALKMMIITVNFNKPIYLTSLSIFCIEAHQTHFKQINMESSRSKRMKVDAITGDDDDDDNDVKYVDIEEESDEDIDYSTSYAATKKKSSKPRIKELSNDVKTVLAKAIKSGLPDGCLNLTKAFVCSCLNLSPFN